MRFWKRLAWSLRPAMWLFASLFVANALFQTPAQAQQDSPEQIAETDSVPGILSPGQAAVTSFGGYLNTPNDDGSQEDRTLDPDGIVLRLMDLGQADGNWSADILSPSPIRTYTASQLGQVFGLAFDDADNPNIYVTATSLYGLRRAGSGADATWAEGQFGSEYGAGPGTIWKIDGTTGEVSLFANVEREGVPNSGPALGNIAFDPVSQQLFVSDRDTGLIHRFDLDGEDWGQFDHGVTARPTTGVSPEPFDSENRLDLGSNGFNPDNPRTWQYAPEARAVFGLAVNGGRLYYAASEGPQIWSVGIGNDGAFEDDPRLEFDVPLDFANGDITDIAFTADRKIVLAQRGRQIVSEDGLRFHSEGNAAVFAFVPESPDDPDTPGRWVEEHQNLSIGYFEPYRMGAGGVSIGHGYTEEGTISGPACKASIWVTGDQLGNAGEEAEPVEGLQGQPMSRLRVETGLPEQITTFSIDAAPNGFGASGYLGDIEVFIRCDGQLVAELDPYEPPICEADGTGDDPRCLPPIEVVEPPIDPGIIDPPPPPGPDLEIVKIAQGERCFPGDDCRFTVLVRNVGDAEYYGPISFEDQTAFNEPISSFGPAGAWQCAKGDFISAFCRHEDVYLAPGEGVSVEIFLPINEDWAQPIFENCATLSFMPWQVGADTNNANNRDCAIAPVCQPGQPGCGPEMALSQHTTGYCETEGVCRLSTRITNRGGETFTGSLSFQIDDFAEGLALQNSSPSDIWSCGPSGVGNYRCFSSPLTLDPGDVTQVDVTLALPYDYETDEAHQCAALTWPAGSGDANTLNDRDCATFNVCRGGDCPAELQVSMTNTPRCLRGSTCQIYDRVTNIGGQVFGNPGESLGVETSLENATAIPNTGGFAAYFCPDVTVNGNTSLCRKELENGLLPEYLDLGQSQIQYAFTFDVSGVPEDQETIEACARIAFEGDQTDPDPSNNEICRDVLLCDEDGCSDDITAQLRRPAACYLGQSCAISGLVYRYTQLAEDMSFTASLTKLDGLAPTTLQMIAYEGPTAYTDAVCSFDGDQSVCQRPLRPAGAIQAWEMTAPVQIPADAATGPREICFEVSEIVGSNASTENDRVCRTVEIQEPPETLAVGAGATTEGLAISKRLLGACRDPGAECSFRHRLVNNGNEVFEGSLTLRDTLTPGGSTLVRSAGQWLCSQAGGAPIDCARGDLRLGPGEAEAFDITLRIPADANGALENCAELTGENAPANEADARSCVTVTIDGEVAPPPPPPPPPEPEPEPEPERRRDLSLTTPGQSGCTSGNLCPVGFVIRNAGEVAYEQALTVRHTMRPLTGGLRLSRLSGNHNGYSCSGSSSTGTCSNPSERLTPGSSNVFSPSVTATAPANGRPSSFEICGEIDWDGAGLATTNAGVRQAQARLNELGFNAGTVDGLAGRQTARAVTAYQQANGLPATGQLDAETYARLVGVPDVWNDDNPGNDRQCTTIQLPAVAAPPPPPTCTGGRFWNGRACVCNPGLQFRNGRCRPIVVDPGPCPVQGQFRNNRGICVCPVGTQPRRGACRPIDTGPAPCSIPGQVRLRGQCVCPSGQQVIRGRCRVPARACTADKILRNGECVCPSGMSLQNGICQPRHGGGPPPPSGGGRVPPQLRGNCPPNHIQVLGNCVPIR